WWPLAVATVAAAALVGVLLPWRTPADEALRPGSAPRTFASTGGELDIALGGLAKITLRPGSELRFVHWRADQALFELERGGLTVEVKPPPIVRAEFFVVATKHGRVVDQGSRYDLDLLDGGDARVRVGEGAVTFLAGSRTMFVPAGASLCATGRGPCTPCFDDAPLELQKTLQEFDMLTAKAPRDVVRLEAMKRVLGALAGPRDSLVLWHLLADDDATVRRVAEGELLALVGAPVKNTKQSSWPSAEWLPFLRLGAWRLPARR
ncbi:MAG: FecR family protein, partial [Planctomycetota bacterium]